MMFHLVCLMCDLVWTYVILWGKKMFHNIQYHVQNGHRPAQELVKSGLRFR